MYGYIYMTTNLVNGKRYIGKKSCDRFLGNIYLGSGAVLHNAIKKYGRDKFNVELLEECNTNEDDLDLLEIKWIRHYNAVESDMFYNLASGGGGIRKGSKMSDSTRRKMSISQMGHTFHGDISKHPILQRGRIVSDITKKRMSENHADISGKNNPMYGKSAVSGRKWMFKDSKRVYVYEEDFDKYLSDGWEFGMGSVKKKC